MKKVRFIKDYGIRKPGDVREYPDQFADWLVQIHVAESYADPEPLPEKKIEPPVKTLKEAKPAGKVTKQEKGKRVTK